MEYSNKLEAWWVSQNSHDQLTWMQFMELRLQALESQAAAPPASVDSSARQSINGTAGRLSGWLSASPRFDQMQRALTEVTSVLSRSMPFTEEEWGEMSAACSILKSISLRHTNSGSTSPGSLGPVGQRDD